MSERILVRWHRGVGLIEVMISIVIAMLMVLVIYQVYEISEGQKRTITAGSDAQQNASYGLYVMARDLSMAGNGIASAAGDLKNCPASNLLLPDPRKSPDPLESLRPMAVVITRNDSADKPDEITISYGGSSSLATSVPFKFKVTTAQAYVVQGPVAFNANDVIAAVEKGVGCTLSTINPNGVVVDAGSGFATLTHTPFAGDVNVTYSTSAVLINLGQPTGMGRVVYSVDSTANTLRVQDQFTKVLPLTTLTTPTPVVSDVVNLKARYMLGLDTNNDGVLDTWLPQDPIDDWSADKLPNQPTKWGQIVAVGVAIVTRSSQPENLKPGQEQDFVAPKTLSMLDGTVKMDLTDDQRHYRYRVLETVVPLRNALWNAP